MAGQASANKLYRTFVKGLITEASYLTYPEDSSLDEDNCVISRKGNRARRLGIDYDAADLANAVSQGNNAHYEYVWSSVGGKAERTFLVTQRGNRINFFDREDDDFAANIKGFSINLSQYTRPGVDDVSNTPCSFASGKGYLFIVSRDSEPLVVSYDPSDDSINVTKIAILARDFEGLRDGLQNAEEPSILTKEHWYNLMNQGWVTTTGTQTSV